MKIWVSVEQKFRQNDSTSKYTQETAGELVEKRFPYVMYTEDLEGEKVDVRVKLSDTNVRISRKGIVNMDFHFVLDAVTQNVYDTQAGRSVMEIHTTKLDYKALSDGGRLILHYSLMEQGEPLGNFKYQLDYKEMNR